MFKKLLLLYLALFLCNISHSQREVGINTTNPEEKLHISGNTSTIRIEGLNAANNPNNYGVRTAPLYVDSNGDFSIPPSPSSSEFLYNGSNMISSGELIQTGTQGQTNSDEIYTSPSFTLSQPANVMIQYSMGFTVWNRLRTQAPSDGKPKTIQNFIYIGDGTTANFTTAYAYSGQSFSNVQNPSSEFIINGFYYNTASEIVFLPAGTYSIHLYGLVSASNGVNFLKTSDSFSSEYGDSSREYLKVIAFY